MGEIMGQKTETFCIYDGPSAYTGKRIRAYLRPHESKTGPVMGLTVIPAGLGFWQSIRAGSDVDSCGACPHRSKTSGGNGSCYTANGSHVGVSIDRWVADAHDLPVIPLASLRRLLRRQTLRSAVYGDAGALPEKFVSELVECFSDTLGYTHAWRTRPDLMRSHVASVDSEDEAREAWAMGWRTFRVADPGSEVVRGHEFSCPASAERGKRLTCDECMACGTDGYERNARSAMIWRHDNAGRHATKRVLASRLSIAAS